MNIFIRQNFVRGVAFKNIISWTFESRFLQGIMEVHKDCFLLNESRFVAMLQAT